MMANQRSRRSVFESFEVRFCIVFASKIPLAGHSRSDEAAGPAGEARDSNGRRRKVPPGLLHSKLRLLPDVGQARGRLERYCSDGRSRF